MAKLLLCHQFFWPDIAPYGSILRVIGEHWQAQQHQVEIFTTEPADARTLTDTDNQIPSSLRIHRVKLPFTPKKNALCEMINSLTFLLKLQFHTLRSRDYDLIMISTMPPLLAGIAGSISARLCSAKFIYHLMDIYPEAITVAPDSRMPTALKALLTLFAWLDNSACKHAACVVVLSDDMKQTLLRRKALSRCANITVLPNFAVPDFARRSENPTSTKGIAWRPGATRFVFAGNIGQFQGLDTLINAFTQACQQGIDAQLVMIGSGGELSNLKKLAQNNDTNILFTGQVSRGDADQAISDADVCIVSLAPGVKHVSFPTKISSYLSQGKPLLGLCETQSSITRLIRDHSLGIAAEQTDINGTSLAIVTFCDKSKQQAFQANAKNYGGDYAPPQKLAVWDQLLNNVLLSNHPTSSQYSS